MKIFRVTTLLLALYASNAFAKVTYNCKGTVENSEKVSLVIRSADDTFELQEGFKTFENQEMISGVGVDPAIWSIEFTQVEGGQVQEIVKKLRGLYCLEGSKETGIKARATMSPTSDESNQTLDLQMQCERTLEFKAHLVVCKDNL